MKSVPTSSSTSYSNSNMQSTTTTTTTTTTTDKHKSTDKKDDRDDEIQSVSDSGSFAEKIADANTRFDSSMQAQLQTSYDGVFSKTPSKASAEFSPATSSTDGDSNAHVAVDTTATGRRGLR